MIRVVIVGLALAACSKQSSTTPIAGGGECPAASGVYIASYVQQEPGKGRNGWALPLHAAPLSGEAPDYATIDTAAATAAGVPPGPTGTLWLTTATGAPCEAKLGHYYAAKLPGPTPSLSYGIELDGCAAPSNLDEAGGIVLVSAQSPIGCRFEVPQPVAGRLGETDAAKKWQRPQKESPLPVPLASAMPPKSCAAPGCETLWAFAEVNVEGRVVVWTGAFNWLAVGAEADQCTWPAERLSGFWIPTGAGATKVTEGQEEHSLPLIAVLADGRGARVALAEANGIYATYDLTAEHAALGHRVMWMIAPPQAWAAVDQLGPICDGATN